jgi:hypothetical protein
MIPPTTAAEANRMARNRSPLPRKTVAKKRSSSSPSRSRSTPMNHKKAMPANGTRFSTRATLFELVSSHAPVSNGSARTESRNSRRPVMRRTEKRTPAIDGTTTLFQPPAQANEQKTPVFEKLRRRPTLESMSNELEDPAGKEQPHGNLPESPHERRDQQKRNRECDHWYSECMEYSVNRILMACFVSGDPVIDRAIAENRVRWHRIRL